MEVETRRVHCCEIGAMRRISVLAVEAGNFPGCRTSELDLSVRDLYVALEQRGVPTANMSQVRATSNASEGSGERMYSA
jgi:hypothetical protein